MKVIEARNVNDAWPKAKWLLNNDHVVRPSRVGEVWECPEPVTTVYRNPVERVLFDRQRNANHVFHFMESLWMLAGRNDVAWIETFNSKIREFVGKDDTQHGSYGFRWRKFFDLDGGAEDDYADQLKKIVRMLKKNPDERRAVLTMWSPLADLERPELADVPCFGGDTVIMSPEGDVAISDLAQQFESGILKRYPVFAVNPDNGDLRLQWCTNVWKSGRKPVLEIGFNDGTSIRCTEDHVLYLKELVHKPAKDGFSRLQRANSLHPIKAADLKVGDRVTAATIGREGKGYLKIKRNVLAGNAYANFQKIHRAYAELLSGAPIPSEFDIHHVDESKTINKQTNLVVVDHALHSSEHRMGDKNPMRNMSAAQHRARACKQSKSIKANWAGVSLELRKIRAKPKRLRTVAEQNLLDGNHKVTSIRKLPSEPVYDFEVPGFHTALVGSGIVAHNCNTQVYFKIRSGKLCQLVSCRSNDALFGAFGANCVHFSFLLEYMAAMIGVGVGTYWQVSDSLHAYTSRWKQFGGLDETPAFDHYHYVTLNKNDRKAPLVDDPESFDDDLNAWMERDPGRVYRNKFFLQVAEPMWQAWKFYKENDIVQAINRSRFIEAADWRRAVQQQFRIIQENRNKKAGV